MTPRTRRRALVVLSIVASLVAIAIASTAHAASAAPVRGGKHGSSAQTHGAGGLKHRAGRTEPAGRTGAKESAERSNRTKAMKQIRPTRVGTAITAIHNSVNASTDPPSNGSEDAGADTSTGATTTTPAGTTTTANTPQPTGDPGNWNLTFDDEFNNTTLDQTKWNPNWFGPTNTANGEGVETTDTACNSPSELNETNGNLALGFSTTPCTSDTGTQYPNTGSLVNTLNKYEFTYGFMEARIYVPTTSNGQLINSLAFWADGTGTWPSTGELDVEEILNDCGPNGNEPGFGYHFIDPNHDNPGACVPTDSTGGWHTFAADWEPGSVTYYYDGQNVGTITQDITSSPMYLILESSSNPTWDSQTIQSSTPLVDYVRVWQHPNN